MLSFNSGNFFKTFLSLLLFYSACILTLFISEYALSNAGIFSELNFLNWDARHYFAIAQNGYVNENVAFFPLFPFLWKLLHVGTFSIAIINGLLYIAAFSLLAKEFSFRLNHTLLLASIPSLIFMFLPFSEAVFFFCSSILLIGYKKGNHLLIGVGILFAGFARPVATIFIPAIIITEYLCNADKQKLSKNIFRFVLVSISSLFLVFLLQYTETGKWFSFFEYQKRWDNYLRLPSFPLSSWAGGYIVRLDAIAFFCGVSSLAWLVYLGIKSMKKKPIVCDKAFVFSITYLGLLSMVVLFTKGGTFNSFNRYLFATPFFIIALNRLLKKDLCTPKNAILIFIASTLFWLFFASYVHIQYLLKFELLSLYLSLLVISFTTKIKLIPQASFCIVMGINLFFFLNFFHRFLSGSWIG